MKTRILALLAAFALSATLANTAGAKCGCGSGCSCSKSKSRSCSQNCRASQIAPTADIPAGYPLKTCVVSGKTLAESEHRIVYTHMQAGRPDRTVVLYDSKSLAAFKKAPAKYLAALDAAEAKQKTGI